MQLDLTRHRASFPGPVVQALEETVGGLVLEVPDFATAPPKTIARWWLAHLQPWRGFLAQLWCDGLLPNCALANVPAIGHDFREVDLVGAEFRACQFRGVDFSEALLEHCRCYRTTFAQCHFTGACLRLSECYDCQFVDCSFRNAVWERSHLEHNTFATCGLRRASLTGCRLTRNRWNQSDFRSLRVVDSAFELDAFEGCHWRQAWFPGTRFAGCTLVNAHELEMPSFDGARIDPDTVQGWYHQPGPTD